jgi:hypothetical protein
MKVVPVLEHAKSDGRTNKIPICQLWQVGGCYPSADLHEADGGYISKEGRENFPNLDVKADVIGRYSEFGGG